MRVLVRLSQLYQTVELEETFPQDMPVDALENEKNFLVSQARKLLDGIVATMPQEQPSQTQGSYSKPQGGKPSYGSKKSYPATEKQISAVKNAMKKANLTTSDFPTINFESITGDDVQLIFAECKGASKPTSSW